MVIGMDMDMDMESLLVKRNGGISGQKMNSKCFHSLSSSFQNVYFKP